MRAPLIRLPHRQMAGNANKAFRRDLHQMGDKGPEHIQKSSEKQATSSPGGAEAGAVLPSGPGSLPPALTEIVSGWSRLPAALQAAMLAIVRTSI